jgi:phosphoribosylformylglycinamidine (FGAM) synthase PurS component
MPDRIEVRVKEGQVDARAEGIKREAAALGIKVGPVERADVYTIDRERPFTPAELDRLGGEIFADPITQRYSVNAPVIRTKRGSSRLVIEIGYKPRLVTDNPGRTSREAIGNLLGAEFGEFEGVYTSEKILLKGVKREDAERLARGIANEIVQGVVVYKTGGRPKRIPIPGIAEYEGKVREIDLDVSDEELMKISRDIQRIPG